MILLIVDSEIKNIHDLIDISLSKGNVSSAVDAITSLIVGENLLKKYEDQIIIIKNIYVNITSYNDLEEENNEKIISKLTRDLREICDSINKDRLRNRTNQIDHTLRVFLSYSHRDVEFKDIFKDHLSTLVRQGKIKIWDEIMISPGNIRRKEIKDALDNAEIIIFLITSGLMASIEIYEHEISTAIERHYNDEIQIIPIYAKPVDIEGDVFDRIWGLPRDKKWLTTNNNLDLALSQVVQELRTVIQQFNNKRRNFL